MRLLLLSAAVVAASSHSLRAQATKVNKYLTYDASTKQVDLILNAADGGANGGMNFNGGSSGDHTITIPAGWKVSWHFTNLDAIPHSAIVLSDTMPFPEIPQQPAIARAYTAHLTDGLPTNGTDDSSFNVPAGDYVIACGVPGHAPSGMWIKFVGSATAKVPTYTP